MAIIKSSHPLAYFLSQSNCQGEGGCLQSPNSGTNYTEYTDDLEQFTVNQLVRVSSLRCD